MCNNSLRCSSGTSFEVFVQLYRRLHEVLCLSVIWCSDKVDIIEWRGAGNERRRQTLGSDFLESLDIVGKPLKLSYNKSSQLMPLVGPVKVVLDERWPLSQSW